MGKAAYWQRGEAIDFKKETGSKIEANTVITLGARIGIAGTDIIPGEVGTLHITGVFRMEKAQRKSQQVRKCTWILPERSPKHQVHQEKRKRLTPSM